MTELPERNMMIGWNNIGPGWRPLVQELIDELDSLDVEWEPLQLKEKFGGLRFYIEAKGPDAEKAFALQMEYEEKSYNHCEECGKPPVPQQPEDGHWQQTLCAEHREERRRRMAERKKELGL